jgi:HTH-type transcriptional regulator/antitoxin HigA
MSTLTVSPEYGALLQKAPPKVIRTEKENEAYTEILNELDQRGKTVTPAEKELTELLTLLIEDFEEKRYRLPRGKPLDVLRFLMEQHGLMQKDVVKVFGTPSIVSEILSGKRKLNNDHIARLSARFHVSLELFFWPLRFTEGRRKRQKPYTQDPRMGHPKTSCGIESGPPGCRLQAHFSGSTC